MRGYGRGSTGIGCSPSGIRRLRFAGRRCPSSASTVRLPCRRSRVRVPSSAPHRSPAYRGVSSSLGLAREGRGGSGGPAGRTNLQRSGAVGRDEPHRQAKAARVACKRAVERPQLGVWRLRENDIGRVVCAAPLKPQCDRDRLSTVRKRVEHHVEAADRLPRFSDRVSAASWPPMSARASALAAS